MPDLILNSINHIFNCWTSFKVAVENGCGGNNSIEKVKWMGTIVEKWVTDNSNLEVYELDDYISEILNNEFDIIVEDGTLTEVSGSILKVVSLFSSNKLAEIDNLLRQLKPANTSNCRVKDDGSSTDGDESDEDEEEDVPARNNLSTKKKPEPMEEDSDGWITVKKK